ncbi:LTA synthase family protein [Chitinophaga caseinilytica]|uniref:Sulfatase-like hydrolase/transferase n=2 Tax=Chitinophaga caseinilytica TaxID=2267521 RepID=A0ABZ2ZB04_9BACT
MMLLLSFIVRMALLIWSWQDAAIGFASFFRVLGYGLLFDIGVAVFFSLPYALYLVLVPAKWNDTFVNRAITYAGFFLTTLILMFSFFAEFTFWEEFGSRFNFIAVDYLIYTYEVINNINESYPLPILIGSMLAITAVLMWIFVRRGWFRMAFKGQSAFLQRISVLVTLVVIAAVYALWVPNALAENGRNRYQDELAKAGVYSFFSAFKNNELNYEHFYRLIDNKEAFAMMRHQLGDSLSSFDGKDFSIRRSINDSGDAVRPNVILVTIESLSADFLGRFGNTNGLTPVLDSLAKESVVFTNMYATGTRTVRGMEALTLAVPPTPGSSIVRRPGNDNLSTVGAIFRQQGYATGFFYGGDGFFDNMNKFFGSNGYAITDKGRNMLVDDDIDSARTTIPDSLINFRNAWGICDEDLYHTVIRDADAKHAAGKPFFDFVMTTSNHRPFTYPEGKIDIPSGSGRDGAVKYTDYAIGQFLKTARTKPWFNNTVIVFVADHCASSAGKNEIDISKYHIPAIVCNLPGAGTMEIGKMCSQIDLFPTLFCFLNWDYSSNLYGENVLSPNYSERIMLGTYQKLAYMKNDRLVILSPQQVVETFRYNKAANEQVPVPADQPLVKEAIANYQTAYYLFKNGGMKL